MKRLLTPAFLMMLLLGTVGLLVTGYFVKKLLAREVPVKIEKGIDIPVALADLEVGTEVTANHLAKLHVLESKIPPGHARSEKVLIGRIVKHRILTAKPINTQDLYAPGERPALEVSRGMRAMAIDLGSGNAALKGIVTAGQYVDVHFTPSSLPNAARTGGLTMTLFKGVKILAVDRGNALLPRSANRGGTTVTMELTEEQANILLLAKDRGALNLVYTPDGPGNGGVTVSSKDRATLDEILGLKEPEVEKEKTPFVTEIYSGSGRRMGLFKDGKRLDRWGIENFDYNRRNGNGYGFGGGYGGGGYGYDRNTIDQPTIKTGGGGGYGGGGYGGGYWSVPSDSGQGQNNQGALLSPNQGQNLNQGGNQSEQSNSTFNSQDFLQRLNGGVSGAFIGG